MKIILILCFIVVFGDISFGEPFSMPSPPPGPDLPNGDVYKMENYWLAPYVRVSEGFGGRTVTWFSENGHIKQQKMVGAIEPGFVSLIGDGVIIQGVNEDWIINLPQEHIDYGSQYSMSGYITSTPDSRVFVQEYHPKGGWVAEDIYVHGKLANKVGPFVQHLADEIQLNDDGSASLSIWKDESRTDVQIVTLDTNGSILAREDHGSSLVAPGGVLLHPNASPDLGPNSREIGWIPGSHKCLYSSSIGFDDRYHLVDWKTGKQLWDIRCLGGSYSLAIGLTPNYVIFAAEELYRPGAWRGDERVLTNNRKEWIRVFYAVNIYDGQVHARWQAGIASRLGDVDRDHFLKLGDKLYYITLDEFTKINLEDIAAKRSGWK